MRKNKRKIYSTAIAAAVIVIVMILAACTTTADSVQATFWGLVPPIIAIGLALLTKEVYSSLFIGILAGALLYTGFNVEDTVNHVFSGGIVTVLSDTGNLGILVFLVILGTMVSLMNKAGGSAAFGRWASRKIKTRVGAQLATVVLGVLIFIDDYFNCLTVGSVMRPVTYKHHVSRAKLAYLIDATAAPVCIIASISSWAAAVSGFVEGEDGLALFIQAIPFNFYALLTIAMMIGLAMMKVDFGPMALHERNALKGDLFTTPERPYDTDGAKDDNPNGSVIDLLIPIVCLIVCCVGGMLYTGGFFSGTGLAEAFAGSNASVGLMLGSFFALVITIVLFLIRRVMTFGKCMNCLPEGFKAMVPAILILTFAWTLKSMTDDLAAGAFVAEIVKNSAAGFMNFLPAVIFLIGCLLSFATGTSWGTFGILIPIVVEAFQHSDHQMMIIAISACMAGAVCGDHCSPISDTTIMSSAGAQCSHVNHVATQLPYALVAAAISFVCYIAAGFTKSALVSLPFGLIVLFLILFLIRKRQRRG